MRKLLAGTIVAAALTLAVSLGTPARAEGADPTVDQIYQAAKAGHLDQAQQMIEQVLRDHPTSGKAHFVQAELFAREGKTDLARSELGQAEQFDPGLAHENARAVQELKSELGVGGVQRSTPGTHVIGLAPPAAPHFPWGTVLVLALVVGVLWMLFRRRTPYAQYPAAGGGVVGGGPGYGGPGYGGPGGYGGYGPGPMGGGGIGSSIAGGLASGLAVGAGVVAGEEVAHHFLDGGRSDGGVVPPAAAGEWEQPSSNSDMGGNDFGVNDSGGWDDSGGGGGGGGDDWS
jgi:hypothetical protein